MKNTGKIERTIPENRTPESIANVHSVLLILGDRGMGFVQAEHIPLSGTIEEKLQQYRDATGKEWSGWPASKIVKHDVIEPESLNLGKEAHEVRIVHPITLEAQKKIDALTKLANKYLREDNEYKKKVHRPEPIKV